MNAEKDRAKKNKQRKDKAGAGKKKKLLLKEKKRGDMFRAALWRGPCFSGLEEASLGAKSGEQKGKKGYLS